MTPEIMVFLLIFVVALVLFSQERIPADVVALGLMLSLIVTGLLTAEEAFAGFGSDVFIMILGLLIMTAALVRTGMVDIVGRFIQSRAGSNPIRLMMVIMVGSALLSAFMSNTASTAFFLPVVLGLAHRAKISPSRLLMPLAFANILSSSVTLVSTSTNIMVSGLMTQNGLAPMGMFELSPVGIPIVVVGIVYMLVVGQRLIPERDSGKNQTLNLIERLYVTEALILPESRLIGKTLAESGLGSDFDLLIMQVVRDKNQYLQPSPYLVLQPEDVLLVKGQREEVLRVMNTAGVDIKANFKLAETDLQEQESIRVVEALVPPRSRLIGRTLKGGRFRERYGLQVLAINRSGESIESKISRVQLKMADILLLQGTPERIRALQDSADVNVLDVVMTARPNTPRAPLAAAIFVGALLLAALNIVPIAVAVLGGALLALLTRCITPEEAYAQVDWKILILIGSMLAFGRAMSETGTADYIADQMVKILGNAHHVWFLTAFFVLTVLLTQPMSNQAAAVVVVPIAIETAAQLDFDPRPFVMMIAIAASCSYLTPLEPACLMVYGAGNYRFFDFVRVGSLLTLLIYGLAILMVPLLWPV